jgi:hypothetical protein
MFPDWAHMVLKQRRVESDSVHRSSAHAAHAALAEPATPTFEKSKVDDEIVYWRGGGEVGRNDADLGVGYTWMQRRHHDDRGRYGSLTFALEMIVAHAPTAKYSSMLTTRYDHTVLLSFGYMFGI